MKAEIASLYTFGQLLVMLNTSKVRRDKYGYFFGGSR